MTTIRLPTGTLTYDELSEAGPTVPDHGHVEVQVELSAEDAATASRGRATLSAGYAVHQQDIRVDYVALMPDGSLETVRDGRVICRSQLAPPNNLWPVRSYDDVRCGSYVLEVASWGRVGAPRVGPREAVDPLWDEITGWLVGCPTLTDIETFWVFDDGWRLLVTGIDHEPEPVISPFEALVVKHWDVFAHFRYRRTQRANRKRRAARKRKRGWA
jgi:hypothetical protein